MAFELKFTPEAEETFDAIAAQLQLRWGTPYLQKFEAKVDKCFGIITENPHIYPIIDNDILVRRCVVHKNCSILYKVDGEAVIITCFWDNRQSPLFGE